MRTTSRLHFGLTDGGKMLLRGTFYITLAALIIPAFGALAVLLAVLLTALAVGFVVRPRVAVSGSLPDHIVAGQTARLTYILKNIGRLPAYHLHLRFHGLPGSMAQVGDTRAVSRLGPGETAEVTVTIRPQRRGRYQVRPPTCQSSFPFSLFHFGVAHPQEETVLVLPAFSWLRMPLRCVSRQVTASGIRLAGRTGAAPEYVGSRPFAPGDSPHRIDVRAWARLGAPATKEYDNDLDRYAALILDTRVPDGPPRPKADEIPELEAAVSLCASVAHTIGEDCLIDFLLAGPGLHSFATWPKPRRVDKVHDVLAVVAPSGDYTWDQIRPLVEERLGEVSEAVFILTKWDETYGPLVEWAERAGCHCTVVIIGKPDRDRASLAAAAERAVLPLGPLGPGGPVLSPEEILAGKVEHL